MGTYSQDKIGSWYSNPGTGAIVSGSAGGGIGKYLKTKNVNPSTATATATVVEPEEVDVVAVPKKRKLGVSRDFNFLGW